MDSFEINKIITAIFLVVLLVFGVNKISDVIFKVKKPDVEGYKYVYPKWTYSHHDGLWVDTGTYEEDRDAYDYYPYFPEGRTSTSPMLVGVKLIKE